LAKFVEERAPGLQAVDGEGAVEFDGEGEVGAEDLVLDGEIGIFHPTVKPAFADGGVGVDRQKVTKVVEPVVGTLLDFPRMEAEGWDDESWIFGGKSCHCGPVFFRGSVDDTGGHPRFLHVIDQLPPLT